MISKEEASNWFLKTTELSKFSKNKPIVIQIIEQTSFLTEPVSLPQRLWHIINDSVNIPICKICNNPVSWDRRYKIYKTYCGNPKCVNNNPDVINKKKQNSNYQEQKINRQKTCLEKYGHTNYLASDLGKQRIEQIILEKYNTTSILLVPEIKEKIKQTMLERYGVDNSFKLQLNQDKQKQTKQDRYGTTHQNHIHMIDVLPFIEDYSWLFDQYVNQNKTAQQIADELNIHNSTICRHLKKQEIAIKYNYNYSYKCICWLEEVMKQEGIYIQHGQNIGEYLIPNTKYKADGYCKETNTIYEFHGDYWHGNPNLFEPDVLNKVNGISMRTLYRNTIKKEKLIKSLGYNLVVIWESDFIPQ